MSRLIIYEPTAYRNRLEAFMDAAITAALITVGGGATLGGAGWFIKRQVENRREAKLAAEETKARQAKERSIAVAPLLVAGSGSLSALDDEGALEATRLVARKQLSDAVAEAQKSAEPSIGRLATQLGDAADRRDRSAMQAILAELRELNA
jgi:hypothetical protein